ncbi:MAG: hypothetical protein F6K53_20045 [Moorea sp. SIO4A1]|uniref:hypothetical protein n=1 Tax=Moorena sp. SIO4A1 TaxID=2607835 RepID=UPI001418E2A2|nr:hypothetical protein [Moorena sp. SIO4A1]NEO43308.1 hypothetical protein [Moorena sp. SIO4A3]NEQ59563.1 hypothetical protein [Moorena sp. SIO4A1]
MKTALDVLNIAVGVLTSSFSVLGSTIGKALDQEVERVQSLNTLIDSFGVTEERAAQLFDQFRIDLANQAKNSPAAIKDSERFARSIFDEFTPLIAAGYRPEDLLQRSRVFGQAAALLSQGAGTTPQEASIAFNSLFSGTSVKGFRQYKLASESPRLVRLLGEFLDEQGVTSTADLDPTTRILGILEVISKAVTEEDIERASKTAKAVISSFTDTLFDPTIGLFSLTRDLDDSIAGNQSAFASFKETLNSVIGSDGILAQIGDISGVSPDAFGLGIKGLVDGLNALLEDFRSAIGSQEGAYAIGQALGDLTAQIFNGIILGTVAGLAGIDWGAFGQGILGGLIGFVTSIDWRIYLGGIVATGLAAAAPSIIGGIVAIVSGGIFAAIAGLPSALVIAVGLGIAGLVAAIRQNWDSITETVSNILNNLKEYFTSRWEAILRIFDGLLPSDNGNDALSFKLEPQSYVTGGLPPRESTVNLGGINLNLAPGTSATTAEEVLQILENEVTQRLEASLA